MSADILLNMPPSAMKSPSSGLRQRSLNDVQEAEEEDFQEGGQMPNGKDRRIQLAWAQDGHAHSIDVPDAAQWKIFSQSAKKPSLTLNNGVELPVPTRSHTTLSSCKSATLKSVGGQTEKGGRRPKAFGFRKDSGNSTSPRDSLDSLQKRHSKSDSLTFPDNGSAANVNGARRLSRRRLPSSSEELSDSLGDLSSPRDRLQYSFNGTMSSDSGSDDFPRVRQLSPTGGTGTRNSQQSGMSGQDGGPLLASPSGPRLWDMFEEHVRTIHDSSDMFSRQQKPSFHSSGTFQETMKNLFGYSDYSQPPPPSSTNAARNVAQRKMAVAGAANRFLMFRKRSSVLGPDCKAVKPPPDRKTVENAKRAWRVLKQYVHDNYLSKRTSRAALGWSMLRQTLKGMSDKDKTRQDLYRRYGIIPTPDAQGNMVQVNTMLSDRARQAIASGARHPLLVHTNSAPVPVAAPSSAVPTRSLSTNLPPSSSTSPRVSAGNMRRSRSTVVRPVRNGIAPLDARPNTSAGVPGAVGGGSRGRQQPAKSLTGLRKSAEWAASKQGSLSRSHSP